MAVLLAACSGGESAGPEVTPAKSCSELTLSVGQVQSLDPANVPCAVLNGSGQRYFITIVNATNSPVAALAFEARGAAGATASQTLEAEATSSIARPALSGIVGEEMNESLQRARTHSSKKRTVHSNAHYSPGSGRP